MKWPRIAPLILALAPLGFGADQADGSRPGRAAVPPVLRNQDVEADVIVRLPGPARVAAPTPVVPSPNVTVAPVAAVAPVNPVAPPEDPPRPLLRHVYPPSFEADSAVFCQKLIGQWTVQDARFLLGEPNRQRPAYDDRQAVNGRIYAFSDPTGRYREMELDFDAENGTLRTVFVYPWRLTWQECRHLWGAQVNEAEAPKGRKFYSYMNRRLDVLVDHTGKVISLGLY